MKARTLATAVLMLTTVGQAQPLYQSPEFTISGDTVRQGPFTATALSRDHIVSTYPRAAREVMFKFSINSAENEFPPGQDHIIYIRPREGRIVSPVYVFGQLGDEPVPAPTAVTQSEEGTAQVTFRLDMRHVLESFRTTGSYDPPNGPPVAAEDFEGVYIIGNREPLTWDFASMRPGSRFQLHDRDGDGIFEVTLPFATGYNRPLDDQGRAVWERTRDLSRFPDYTSDQTLIDAEQRLALEELAQLIRPDGSMEAGAHWPQTWTRDTAWQALLAFAIIAPEQIRLNLMQRLDAEGRILQDTGTGGSWPVSTDRTSWSLAAWEIYAVTGDREWLRTAYEAIRRSSEADLAVVFDEEKSLFRGESSFLDWRDQSYPAWMDPKDIATSAALGTNALHHGSYRVLGKMAREMGEPSARWDAIADRVADGMNTHLWLGDRGWYGQFVYGPNNDVLSPRSESLGAALAILTGVPSSEQEKTLVARLPVVPFGVPSFWPYIGGISPYHNAGIWPQVTGFWTWAAAEAGNTAAVEHGLASLLRTPALFLTNKENMVAETGHSEGTELNSDRFGASIAATLSTVYRILLGMRFEPDGLRFEPFVPKGYEGVKTLENFRYRDMTLKVIVRGFGTGIASVKLDGVTVDEAFVPGDLTGAHTIELDLDGKLPGGTIHIVRNLDSPRTPRAWIEEGTLRWDSLEEAVGWRVYRDGQPIAATSATKMDIEPPSNVLHEYQVAAVGPHGIESFLSEPIRVVTPDGERVFELPEGGLRTTPTKHMRIAMPVEIASAGRYRIDVFYANGAGPVNSNSRAAVRSLLVDGVRIGSIVMPQRGTDLWDDFGWSSAVEAELEKGPHEIVIAYTPVDRNMDLEVNDASISSVRLTRVE